MVRDVLAKARGYLIRLRSLERCANSPDSERIPKSRTGCY